ncbi:7tm Odorant receptor [Popillia japonica]|uniref:7tm Odorant receptor n=1 Tax=Popillia japonica TaxID=7064 RepID=A0AAW1IAL0_POPJA
MMLHFIVNSATLSVLVLNIVKGIRLNKPMFINRMIWIVIPLINFLAKLLAIHKNKKYYLLVIKNLKSDIFNIQDKKLRQHILLIERISELMWKYFALTIGVLYLVSCVFPVVMDTEPLMPCPVDIGRYDILYRVLHLAFTFYYAVNSPGCDLLLMSLLGICIAQLSILKERLTGLSNSNNGEEISPPVDKTLSECVALHKMINE